MRTLAHFCCCLLLTISSPLIWAAHNPLLPQPQSVQYGGGVLKLDDVGISLPAQVTPEDRFAAEILASGIRRITGQAVSTTLRPGSPHIILERTGAVDALPGRDETEGPESRESYQIRVTPRGAEIKARSSAGLYYGAETFLQLVEGKSSEAMVPEVSIDDWPVLAYRGVMMDLSHGGLPTESEIEKQIDFLAQWKGNQYYFYSELSIEFKGYPLINPDARYSQDEVRRIIVYARERHIDVIPCLEFYGHLHDLFRLEKYADLAPLKHGSEINPTKQPMQQILSDLAHQMAILFPSPWFHIGLDEPWELQRAGSTAAGGIAPEKLYIDHLKHMATLLESEGKRAMFWADIDSGANLFNKYPQLVDDLPSDVIAVPWHYAAENEFAPILAPFRRAKIAELVGTGIWGWDTITPDFDVTFANIDGFVRDGRKSGTLGIINTNWADDAQILYRATLPGIAYGAIAGWQSSAIDRPHFFEQYCAQMYNAEAAGEVATGLKSLSSAQVAIKAALGPEDALRMWDDPFSPGRLQMSREHVADLQSARLAAEDAEDHFYKARSLTEDSYSLPSLLFGARMLDYAGMKYLYAVEIADMFNKIRPNSSREDVWFWLENEVAARNHSRLGDLMDTITELRETYRSLWLAEYRPFRLGTASGRFDAEYEYWRKLQANIWQIDREYKPGFAIPTLQALTH